jgi:hypothetical protein
LTDLPVCIFCGCLTANWWYLDGKTNTCRCSDCYSSGAAETDFEIAFFAQFPRPSAEGKKDTPSPISKCDVSIWKLHLEEGSERLHKWANENAKRKGYL